MRIARLSGCVVALFALVVIALPASAAEQEKIPRSVKVAKVVDRLPSGGGAVKRGLGAWLERKGIEKWQRGVNDTAMARRIMKHEVNYTRQVAAQAQAFFHGHSVWAPQALAQANRAEGQAKALRAQGNERIAAGTAMVNAGRDMMRNAARR